MSTYSVIKGFETSTCAGENFIDLWMACINKTSFIGSDGLGRIKSSTYSEKGNPLAPLLDCIKKAVRSTGDESWLSTSDEIGVILATTTGHTAAWEESLINYLNSDQQDTVEFTSSFSKEPLGFLLAEVKKDLGINGPSTVISTACSASTHSLGIAKTWIQLKKVKRCLVISTELLCLLTTKGFASFNLLSEEPCKPFDKDRTGINLSEAFGCICIEGSESVSDSDVYIAGFGASTDTFQMTTPDPEGKGTIASISMALKNASTPTNDVNLIHCHGTASHYNDLAETVAIKNLWPSTDKRPFVTSTKGVHGHALGASGLIETCIVAHAMKTNTCPPTLGFKTEDPELGISPVTESTRANLNCVVKNTLGFGGANASIVLKKGPRRKETKL